MMDAYGPAEDPSEAVPSISIEGADAAFLIVPDTQLLFSAEFKRSGPDLTLIGPEGHRLLIEDYFRHGKLPDLVSPDGAVLAADVVEMLAGPLAPGQYAQATAPVPAQAIGKVEKVTGFVTVLRNGATVNLNVGDALNKGDLIQTGSDSTLGISLLDGTALNLSANTRMAMNEFIFDVNSNTSNGGHLSLVQGAFALVSGLVAKTGGLNIETPVAIIGIRGTVLAAACQAVANQCEYHAAPEITGDKVGQSSSFDLLTNGTFENGQYVGGTVIKTVTGGSDAVVIAPGVNQPLQVTDVTSVPVLAALTQQAAQLYQQLPPPPTPPTPQQPQAPNPQSTSPGTGSSTPSPPPPPPPPPPLPSPPPPPPPSPPPPPPPLPSPPPPPPPLLPLVDQPPVVSNPIPDQNSNEDTAWSFTIPANTFSDADSPNLTLAASLVDGSPLPIWLAFNPATATFSGTPPADANGTVQLKVVASDGTSSVADTFTLNVIPVNDAPTVISGTAALAAITEGNTNPSGQTVSQILNGNFSDAADQVVGGSSANAFAGVAISGNAATAAQGTWEYFNGSAWVAISTGVSETQALVLSASTPLRFVPAPHFNGTAPALTVHLIDDSAGAVTDGSIVNLATTGATGGSTQYSVDTVAVSETIAPALMVTSVDYGTNDGTLKAGETVTLTVNFSETITVTGNPTLSLNDGATATYTGGTGTSALTFSYTVASGENTSDLAVTAFNLPAGATVRDAASNDADLTGAVTNPAGILVVDTLAPSAPTIDAVATDDVINLAERNATVTVTGTNEAGSTVTLDGNAVVADTATTWHYVLSSAAIDAFGQGGETLTAVATDAAGNTTSSTRNISVETIAPSALTAVTLTPVGGTVVANTVNTTNTNLDISATITAGEATGGKAEFYVNGVLAGTDSSIASGDTSVTFTTSDGTPTNAELQAAIAAGGVVTVKLYDAAGNATTSAVSNPTLIVDYSPPAAPTIDAVATDDVINLAERNATVTVTGTNEAGSTVTLDGNAVVADTATTWHYVLSSAAIDAFGQGGETLTAVATDAAGNTTSSTRNISVDTVAPAAVATVTALSADTGTPGDFITTVASQTVSGTFTGTLGTGEKIQVSADGTFWVDATAGSGTWSASGVTLSSGAGTLSVRTVDTAGNITTGTGHSYTFTDVTVTIVTPNGYDMHGLYGDIAGSSVGAHDATHFDAINAGSGHTFRLIGNYILDGGGTITGGTVSEIDILNTATGAMLVTMTGFAIDEGALSNAVAAITSDPSQLSAIFNQYSYNATGGAGNDTLLAFAKADTFDGGAGLNTVDYVHYGSGITVNLADPSQNTGNAAGDTYTNVNSVIGTNYNDTLIGDANINALEGGAGADHLVGGGGALDYASYIHAPETAPGIGVTADLADPSQNTGDAAGDTYVGINSLIGSNYADILIGDANDNYLRGRGGADTLIGGGGSDTADYARGGAVRADLSNPATNTGDAAGDTYDSIENLRGSDFNDILVGDAGDNTIDGGLGIDQTIYTGATGPITVDMAAGTVSGAGVGNDTLISVESVRGSSYNDIYVATGYAGASAIGSVPTTYNEFEGMAGDDHITGNGNTAISYLNAMASVTVDLNSPTVGVPGSTGIAHATAADAGIGTDTIFGGVNVVRGSAYDDVLLGSNNTVGVELFEGDGGNDFINGRGGFDRVTYAPLLDNTVTGRITVNLAAGTVVGDASVGTDTLRSIESVRGTQFADTFDATGFTASSTNAGSAGVDNTGAAFNEFEGMGGDDTIIGNGNTRISFINAKAGVTVDLALTTVSGSTGIAYGTALGDVAGIGTDTIFGGVNAIVGSSFDDQFYGSLTASGVAEQFDGGAGNDTIDGRGGFDRAVYNADNGTTSGISVDMAAGTVIGDASIGTDTLISVESVRGTNFDDTYVATGFTGASADLGLGVDFNEFEGMGGNDTITGNGNTRISYISATGGVTVDLAAGTATGDASVGNDIITGGVNRVRGSNFDDTITGDANANVLDGRGGNDTLTGGGGADTFIYADGYRQDTVTDFNHSQGDKIDLTGVTGIYSLDNVLALATQSATNTIINFGFGNTLTLNGITLADLTADDFIFKPAPVITGDMALTVVKGDSVVLTTADFQAVLPGTLADQITFNVTDPTHGWVALASAPGTPVSTFMEADLEAGSVIFVQDGSDTTQATFKVSVTDGLSPPSAATTIIATVPTVSFNVLTATGFDFDNAQPIMEMGAGAIQSSPSPTSAQFTIISAHYKYVIDGTGFAFAGSDVTGGTITTIHVSMLDDTPLFDIIGNIDAATWYDAVVAAAAGDFSQIDPLVSKWSFNFVGGAGSDSSVPSGDLNDFFQSSGGNDLLDGQFGYDRADYTPALGAIAVQLAAGTVTKYTGAIGSSVDSSDTLRSIEFVTGTDFNDTFDATGFNKNSTNAGSTVTSDVNGTFNEFEGRGGNDIIFGNGNTRISYLHATSGVLVNLALGVATGDASVGTDTFTGVNSVRGSEFADFLYGSNNPTPENFEGRGGNDFINGGGGFDRAVYTFEDSPIVVQLAAGTVVGGPNTGTDTLRSIEAIAGTQFADTYDASGFTSSISGSPSINSGNFFDSLLGQVTDFNEFEGGGGNDTITGNGNTRVAYYNATAGVTVTLGPTGSGTSYGTAPGDLAGVGSDTFVSGVKDVIGSAFGDIITGNGGNNTLIGQGGNDVLNSKDGNDMLTGGTGSDIFMYHPHSGAGGNDIITDFNQSEGDRIDLREAHGSSIVDFTTLLADTAITQVESDTVITFNATGLTLTLQGFTGTLTAADFIFHGALHDQVAITVQTPDGYNFGTLYDDIAGSIGAVTVVDDSHFTATNSAHGLVFSITVSGDTTPGDPLTGTINAIDIYDLDGNILANTNGWNFLASDLNSALLDYVGNPAHTSGLDAIFGAVNYSAVGNFVVNYDFNNSSVNFGGDTFLSWATGSMFNGLTNANGDYGNGDTVEYSHAASAVTVDLSVTGAQAGAGNDILINIENLRGSAFDDHLTGDNNLTGNVLEGGAGNDTLDGGGGGNDTASYEHAPDLGSGVGVVANLASPGGNTGDAAGDSYNSIENLRGSAYNDTLTGDGNDNVIEGGAGADALNGGGGNDTASYEHAATGVTASLDVSVTNTGDAAGDTYTNIANLFGSRFNDTLIGDGGNNVLNGFGTRDGSDTLTGKGGADTFVFNGGSVIVTDFDQGNTGVFNSTEGDKIDLSYSNFGNGLTPAEQDAALTALIAASTGDTIDFGNGQVLTLANVVNVSSTLHTTDFILHP